MDEPCRRARAHCPLVREEHRTSRSDGDDEGARDRGRARAVFHRATMSNSARVYEPRCPASFLTVSTSASSA
jgi:hypothetical protein